MKKLFYCINNSPVAYFFGVTKLKKR